MNFIIVDRRLGGAQRNPTIPMKTFGFWDVRSRNPSSHCRKWAGLLFSIVVDTQFYDLILHKYLY
jgi:hypothetical protein